MALGIVRRIDQGHDSFEDFRRHRILRRSQVIGEDNAGFKCRGFIPVVGEVHPGKGWCVGGDLPGPSFRRFSGIAEIFDSEAVLLELLDVPGIADGHQQQLPAFVGFPDPKHLHTPGCSFEPAHVFRHVQVLGVILADFVAEDRFRRRNPGIVGAPGKPRFLLGQHREREQTEHASW